MTRNGGGCTESGAPAGRTLATSIVAESDLPIDELTMARVMLYVDHERSEEAIVLERRTSRTVTVPLVRIQSACLTGEILGSLRCDCGPQLTASLRRIAQTEWGMLLYFPSHEGRGIGLTNKIRAYALQDSGFDTFSANEELGLAADSRDYKHAAGILADRGATDIHLLTKNPLKRRALIASGINVVRSEPLDVGIGRHNSEYLRHKANWFDALDEVGDE